MSLAVAFFFCTPTHKPIQQPLYINIMLEGWGFANYDGVTVGCGRPLWCGMCSVAASSSFFPPPAPESARRATSRGGCNCGDDGGGWGAAPRVSIPISRAFLKVSLSVVDCLQSFPFWGSRFCRGLSAELPILWAWSGCQSCTAVKKKKAPF